MHRVSEKVTELADKIVGAVPWFDAAGQKIAVVLYRLLSEGHPVPLTRLADVAARPVETVRDTVAKWPVFRDDQGAVVGFGGLTVVEMPLTASSSTDAPSIRGARGIACSFPVSSASRHGSSPSAR